MRNSFNGKIIKPPFKRVSSGKIFKPSKTYLYKILLQPIVAVITMWLLIIIGYIGIISAVAFFEPSKYNAIQLINTWFIPISLWTILINSVWLIPTLIFIPLYYKSIEYSVKAETGESMPEVYVKKGIVTITQKHVPFRTITNVSSRAGPFDRIFKIGSVHIETAGYSGTHQTGPEIKLEGIVFYEEIRDYIIKELRRFREPYTTGTERVYASDEPVPRKEGLDDEILITLREIRDILRKNSFTIG
jgi:membrane protein YdbS with pleckstrin-like domain